jgi:hypothetical protein
MIYWTSENVYLGYTFSKSLWFEIDRNFLILLRNKNWFLQTPYIDNATFTGSHGHYISYFFFLWWRQHMIISDSIGHCIVADVTDSRNTILIRRIILWSSAPNISFKLCRRRFTITTEFAMKSIKIREKRFNVLNYVHHGFLFPITSSTHFPDPLHLTTSLLELKGIDNT